MSTKEQVYTTILNSITEFNSEFGTTINTEGGREAVLFGDKGLDSLGLVNLIVKLEEDIAEKINAPIVLATEKAMSRKVSPFLSIGTLTDYVYELVQETK